MKNEKNSNVGNLQGASFLSLGMMGMGVTVVTPALATFAVHWEGANVSFIQTLTTLGCVLGSLIAGMIMGKKIQMKHLAILSSALCLVFGIMPAFFDSFSGTLVCRTAFGLALGLLTPLANALIMQYYSGEKQASMLGYSSMAMSLGGILFQTLGGTLAAKSWNLTFYGHIFFLIALIMAFFIPLDKKQDVPGETANHTTAEKMSSKVWILAIVMLVFNMVNMPIMMNASLLFEARNAGGAVAAANALNVYTIAGVVAGFLFGKIFGILKRWTVSFAFVLCVVGATIMYFGESAVLMGLGMGLIGAGFNVLLPVVMALVGMVTPGSTVGKGTSIVIALMNLGGFLGSFWLLLLTKVFGESLMSTMTCEIVIFLVIAVIFAIYNPFKGHLE